MTLTDLELFEYILDERHIKNRNNGNHKKHDKNKNDDESKDIEHVFNGIDDESWKDVIDYSLLEKIEVLCKERWESMTTNEDDISDAVNLNSNIMRSLFDIDDPINIHQNTAKFQQVSKFLLLGSKHDDNDNDDDKEEEVNESKSDSDSESESETEDENQDKDIPKTPLQQLQDQKRMSREELREIRRANKKLVKAENREKRKHKIPKKVKKRKIKVARLKAGKSVWKG